MPLFGERALHIPSASAVVVGDLHVGLESGLREMGVNIPSQTERMRERLLKLLEETKAARLIVIGDLKHKVPYSTQQEISELPWFFRGFPARVELVRGNHDVGLAGLLDVVTHEAGGIRVGDVGLLHGHEWPTDEVMEARILVTCHNHPAVMLVDELGHRHKEACWVRTRFMGRAHYATVPDELIVMPAFNELTGGTAFNAPEGRKLLGPFFGQGMVDLDGARIYTVDGVDLGTVAGLRQYGGKEREPRKPRFVGKGKRKPGWID